MAGDGSRPMAGDGVLASIPGERISRAALTLPEAASAPDLLHYVEIKVRGRRILLTFKRFQYKRPKTTRWFWTCEAATAL
jgi:hypothetical protein